MSSASDICDRDNLRILFYVFAEKKYVCTLYYFSPTCSDTSLELSDQNGSNEVLIAIYPKIIHE